MKMKRELKDIHILKYFNCGCCPGHDRYPDEVYRSNRSKKARSKGKKIEHRYVRRVKKQLLRNEVEAADENKTP
jgi:hypothetical protein